MKRYSGFTLVEILLVLAIIATLSVLVFASFGPSREKSRQTVCLSNLHQIGQAFAMYIADYDGAEPQVGVERTHAELGLPPNVIFLNTYLKNQGVLQCPSYHDTKGP